MNNTREIFTVFVFNIRIRGNIHHYRLLYHGIFFRLSALISGPLRDPLIAVGCFAIGLRGSALRAPPIRPMEP
ncbi:MAG: hypothetical protein KJO61_04805, partial [Deltaproteobacteria bacterium]|nr:hypothetical protein [Deltaproteobacteria bacterium]